ncbi:MAG: NAD-dependent epimerase/dehydratase family protein [Myxococcota bacterium]|nr:NAD-dependent epimerase/dehydratase family protein [Myxococcota bacterium]
MNSNLNLRHQRRFPPDIEQALKGRRTLVTGGPGFLGQYLVQALRDLGAEVLAPTRKTVDLLEQQQVRNYLAATRPQYVIHGAAACGGIGANVQNPGRFLYENAMMGLMLIDECRRVGTQKFALVSTTCAYPKSAPMPLQEDTIWDGAPTGATGPYGMAKRLLHEAIATYGQQYNFAGNVFLPANLYGPYDHFDPENSHVVAAMIRRYVEAKQQGAETITHWGSGSPTREFLHVRDAVRGMLLGLVRDDLPRPVNLGTGIETSIRTLAEIIAELTQFSGATDWDTSKPDGQKRRVLNIQRAAEFGFEAAIPLREGLVETIDWYVHHVATRSARS